jgi:nucleoside-specific outer membrane channel protein Tsx
MMLSVSKRVALAGAALGICVMACGAQAADIGSSGGYKDALPTPSYFIDDVLSFRYGTAFKEPGVNNGNDIEKGILNFQHFNTDKWGSNFIDIDFLFSTGQDPVNNITAPFSNGGPIGATEVYGIFRRDWSYSKITGNDISNGIIKDVELRMGGDFNTKNDPFSAEKRLLVVGPKVDFNVPVGFFYVAALAAHEWNHNGFCNCATEFNTHLQIEAAWAFPFTVGNNNAFTFKGFFVYVAPKGDNPFSPTFPNNTHTVSEILTRPEILLDVGNYWGQKGKFEVGFGYEYWLNKFGNNHDAIPGALANTPELIARWHIN